MNHNILLFWSIGKKVYEEQNTCENVFKKYSDYCSYYMYLTNYFISYLNNS